MPKQYKIRDGFTFRGDNGQLTTGGETIELEDDVAAQHAHKLELIEAPKRRIPTKQAAAQDAGAGVTAADAQDSAQADPGAPQGDQGAEQADQPADQQ